MTRIAIEDSALDLVKSGLNLKKRILKLNLVEYRKRLSEFESKYHMPTQKFLHKFNAGQLGDDQYLFDWLFAQQACKDLSAKLNLLKKVKL